MSTQGKCHSVEFRFGKLCFVLNKEAWNWTEEGKKKKSKSGKGSGDNISKNEAENRGRMDRQ